MRRLLRPAIAVALVAFGLRVDPVIGIAVLLGVWGFASWVLPARAVAGVTGTRQLPSSALFGEEVEVRLQVSSERRLPWLAITDSHPFDLGESRRWVTALGPGETRTDVVRLHATARGLHRIGPAVAVTGDGFGGRKVQKTLVSASTILIYPRIVPIEDLAVAAAAPLPLIPTRTPLYEDPTRIIGVRQYETGDPMRRIHWSASAASGDLQVKKFRPAIARDVVVLVDLGRDSHPTPGRRRSAELAVTTAASIVHHLAVEQRESVGLRLLYRDTPTGQSSVAAISPGRDQSRVGRMLESLARSDLTPIDGLDALVDPATLPFGASVVLVTGRADRRHLLHALRLRRLGMPVTVILTASDLHYDDAGLERLGVPVRRVARLAEMIDL
ncbi:MAG: DUF58 domain-containing protein [Acidimicrobiia bacterium]|nr:DUF58 domain-containing protein [Acidimicrobiia bacterium]